jgi:hypothetical protein
MSAGAAPKPTALAKDGDAQRLAGAPFVASVRARPDTIQVNGGGSWMIRAQIPEVWDMVRLEIDPSTPVIAMKHAAVAALMPDADGAHEFVTKLNGVEVLDENASVAEAGALNGSTFLITFRRRRPVR